MPVSCATTTGPWDMTIGPLADSNVITKLPAQDLDRARAFYRNKLGLEPVEEREGGLRYCTASGEFHVFASSGDTLGRQWPRRAIHHAQASRIRERRR